MCAYVNNAFDLLNQAQSLSAGAGKKKKKAQNKPQAAENGANGQLAAGPTGGVVEVADGIEQIERAALDARSVADKCRLWKEWARLAGERGPRATRYKDADGTQLDFTTVLLRSRAFESSLESAFAQGLANERQEAVAQLLLTCTHMSPATAQALATSLVQLSALTQNEAMDVKAAAQHAVRSIAVSLKAGQGEGGSLADKANRLGQAIVKEQAALQRLQASSTGAAAKEQAEVARRIFRLTGEQFALLQADGQPSTASALDQLRATISTKIKAPKPSSGKGKGKGAGGQQGGNDSKAALLASLRKEDAALAAQAEQLAGQIRTLEAQLRSLRGQQQQVEDNRAALQQRMRMAGDSSQQAGKAGGNAAQQQQQLAAVDLLASVMQQASNTDPDVQAVLPMVSADFVAAGRQYLAAAKASLSEMPARISFCKQRIAQAEGLLRLGSKDNGKIKEDAERLMADLVRSAEDLRATSNQVATEVQQRHDAIMAAAPDAATLDVLRSIDGLLADVHAAYDSVQHQLAPPVPAAPAPAPAAPARAAAPAPAAAPPAAAISRPAAAPVAAPAAPVAQPAPAAAAAAPPAAAPQPVVNSAFDRAGDLLASLPGLSARPESAATGPARKAAPPAAAPRPASAASTAPRQWGKPVAADVGVLAVAATDLDASLPTPAEAFKIPAAPAAAVGVEGEAKPKKRNQRHA